MSRNASQHAKLCLEVSAALKEYRKMRKEEMQREKERELVIQEDFVKQLRVFLSESNEQFIEDFKAHPNKKIITDSGVLAPIVKSVPKRSEEKESEILQAILKQFSSDRNENTAPLSESELKDFSKGVAKRLLDECEKEERITIEYLQPKSKKAKLAYMEMKIAPPAQTHSHGITEGNATNILKSLVEKIGEIVT